MNGSKEKWQGMNRKERRAALVLAGLCLLTSWSPAWFPERQPAEAPQSGRFRMMLESLAKKRDEAPGEWRDTAAVPEKAENRSTDEATLPALRPFPFDPNHVTEHDLRQMGIPERVASNWLKYRQKGGRFRSPSALRKIYGMDADLFEKLAPFIQINESPSKPGPDTASRVPAAAESVLDSLEINSAEVAEWQGLWGIGPVLAARIVRFRDAMGGFNSVAQVAETFGLPDSTFERIRPRLTRRSPWRKWALNRSSADSLARHPYLGRHQARAIVAYRDQHGPFASARELRRVRALPDTLIDKLLPYLDFSGNDGPQ